MGGHATASCAAVRRVRLRLSPSPSSRRSPLRRPVTVLGALALVLAGAGTASAEPPLEVTGQITDQGGVLGTGKPAAERAVADLAAEDELGLHAVFVSSFDDADPGEWAQDTAQLSGLDETDLLLEIGRASCR